MPHPTLRHLFALGLVVPALLMGCGSDETPDDNDDDTPEDPGAQSEFAREMLETHNAVRAGVTPAASPALEPLTWDAAAEAKAKAYAAKCQFVHNAERGNYGENLAAATPDYLDTPDVVKDWAKEASNYDYASNSCAEGKVCGHYTQVVWRATKRVGCATQVCTQNSPFGARFPTWQLWVCNYGPPGNYVGQRPY
ncbi:CAP domain-containing protein [Pyxidicoccus sp. 3LG]